jgi:hypothetical protein
MTSTDDGHKVQPFHSAIRWVRDSDRILIVDMRNQHVYQFIGEEAALWSWLASGLGESAFVPLLAEALAVPKPEAEVRWQAIQVRWREAGLLTDRDGADG